MLSVQSSVVTLTILNILETQFCTLLGRLYITGTFYQLLPCTLPQLLPSIQIDTCIYVCVQSLETFLGIYTTITDHRNFIYIYIYNINIYIVCVCVCVGRPICIQIVANASSCACKILFQQTYLFMQNYVVLYKYNIRGGLLYYFLM